MTSFDPAKVRACINKPRPKHPDLPPGVLSLVLETSTLWTPGHAFTVGFFAGSAALHARVMAAAKVWERYANVTFTQVADAASAQVRINFTPGQGSYSYIGTGILDIPTNQETLNLGWITDDSTDEEVGRVVVHEVGHSLGMEHEQSSPVEAIPWDYAKAYAYFEQTQGWSRSEVYDQVFAKLTEAETTHTTFDPASIMMYPVDGSLTTNGWSCGWNQVPSPTDIQKVGSMYPFAAKPIPPVVVPPVVTPPPVAPPPHPLVAAGLKAVNGRIPGFGEPAAFTLDISDPAPFTLAVVAGKQAPAPRGKQCGVIIQNAAGNNFPIAMAGDRGIVSGPPGRYVMYAWHPSRFGSGLIWTRDMGPAAAGVAKVG